MIAYHDLEWGEPCHDDRALFERLMLECFQAGLSWSTILQKREHFSNAFDEWSAEKVAGYDAGDVERLLLDQGIVRNRLKVMSAIINARGVLAIRREFGSFDRYLTSYIPMTRSVRQTLDEIPVRTPESDALSKDLRRRGFKFVGSTICYAFMQSVGLVNDHLASCFRGPRS